MLTVARRMQGRQPRHALPGIQEPLGGGNPKRYLEQTLGGIFWVFPPDWAQLGDEKGKEEGGKSGKKQGAWEGAEVGGGHLQGACNNCHQHLK